MSSFVLFMPCPLKRSECVLHCRLSNFFCEELRILGMPLCKVIPEHRFSRLIPREVLLSKMCRVLVNSFS